MDVFTKNNKWIIPLGSLPAIGLLNNVHLSTGESQIILRNIDDNIFGIINKYLKTKELSDIDGLSTGEMLNLITICDYLQYQELLDIFCYSIARRMETFDQEGLLLFRSEWNKNTFL